MLSPQDEARTDGMLIGAVASDSDPKTIYFLWRFGTPRAQGGSGTEWKCSCPSRQRPHCKHLRRFFAGEYEHGRVALTPEGERFAPPQTGPKPEAVEPEPPLKPRREGVPRIYTIGHGSRDLEGFLAQLREQEVTLLVDLRSWPRSRWTKWFDKVNLSKPGALGEGMRYRHMPELGGYNPDKSWPKTKDDAWHAGIRWLVEAAFRETVAMFCMETDFRQCHRHMTVEPDLLAACPELEIVHLPPPGKGTKQQTLDV